MFSGANSKMEKLNRLKRIKTSRLRLERGEFDGVDLICTRNRRDSILFMIKKLEEMQQTFNPRRPPTKTLQQLKLHINTEMKNPTFLEYLRQRKKSNVADVKAMKVCLSLYTRLLHLTRVAYVLASTLWQPLIRLSCLKSLYIVCCI